MSNDVTRLALAEALSTVTGLTGYTVRPKAPRIGDAWPLWRGSERGAGHGYLETWAVVIVTPQDEKAASQFSDERQDDLDEALGSVIYIDTYAPVTVPTEGGDMFALMITGRSE